MAFLKWLYPLVDRGIESVSHDEHFRYVTQQVVENVSVHRSGPHTTNISTNSCVPATRASVCVSQTGT